MPSIETTAQTPLILALDTASSLGSVALVRGERLLGGRAFEAKPSHSQQLLPAIQAVCSDAGITPSSVDVFAAVVGPGSFTGLRVSLACVRGLAGTRPCFGALATDVAAWAARGRTKRILAITDLFHGEVFGSIHDADGSLISARESGDLKPVLSALREHAGDDLVATGSAAMKHRDEIAVVFPTISFLELSDGLAPHLASMAVTAGTKDTVQASDLMPFYLRDPLTRGLLNTQPKAR